MSKVCSRVLGATAALVLFVSCNSSTPKFSFTHAERRGKLPNGLRFVIMPDATTQLAQVDIRYEVGAKEDPPGKAGLAHLVEHMVFQIRPDGPTKPPLMKSINDLNTGFNAYTNWDTTHYQNMGRVENLDAMVKIEAMRIYYGTGCDAPAGDPQQWNVSNDEFLREREVVRNEIRQRGGTAEGQIPQLVLSSIYPKGHAYERMIGGDDAQLSTITLADVCKFIKDYYVPERATVIVAGGVKVDDAVASITKWFGKLEKRAGGPLVKAVPIEPTRDKKTFDLDIERPYAVVAWALPPSNTPEGELAQYGAWNAFSRTARKSQEYDFAYSVQPTLLGGQYAPLFAIIIELKGMGKLDEALEFVSKGAKQAYRGFDAGTWEQNEEMKNVRKAQFIESLEELGARTEAIGNMVQFSKDFDFDSQALYLFHELDKISKFDGDRVGPVVKKYMDPERARVVVFKPNKDGIKGDQRSKVTFQTKSHDAKEDPDVDPAEARRPFRMSAQLSSLKGAQRTTLGNGMSVVLLPVKSMPLVAARLIFNNVGSALVPDNPALSDLAAGFLSSPLDSEALMRTGLSIGCQGGQDATVCSTSGINIYLDVMVKGLERHITAGTYSQERVESWQKNMRGRLATKEAQQQLEFDRQFATAVYGPEHPYARTGVLGPDAVGKVSRDKLDDFRRSHYTAGNATLIITGDFDPKVAEGLVRDVFGGWSKGRVDTPVAGAAAKRAAPSFVGVIGKEEPQLEVRIAYPAPAGVDGQEGARRVLAEMMQSRVADVRFKLGSTYGVYAGRSPRKGPTAYMIGGTVDAERAGESIKAIRDGLDKLRTGETFDVDFVRARRKIISVLLGESTVTAQLAARLGFIAQHGLDADYYNTMLQLVAASSPAQVRTLLQSELDPAHEIIVVQGDKKHLDRAFAEAGIKDVKIVEPEYK